MPARCDSTAIYRIAEVHNPSQVSAPPTQYYPFQILFSWCDVRHPRRRVWTYYGLWITTYGNLSLNKEDKPPYAQKCVVKPFKPPLEKVMPKGA